MRYGSIKKDIGNSLLLCGSGMMVIIGLAMIICGLALSSQENWLQMSGGFLAFAGGSTFTVCLSRIKDDEEIEDLAHPNSVVPTAPAQFCAPVHIAISLNTSNSYQPTLKESSNPDIPVRILKASL